MTFNKPTASALFIGLILFSALLSIIAVFTPAFGQRESVKKMNGKSLSEKDPASARILSEDGPGGRWSGTFIPDLKKNSSNSPVVVVGTTTLMGDKNLHNLQLTGVKLKNFSGKALLAVQLMWTITTKQDVNTVLPPPGYTGLFETLLKPEEEGEFECPIIMFSKVTRHLVKDGELKGDFVVHIMVFSAEFDDGTSWNEAWGGPKPGEMGEPYKPE